MGLIKKNFKIVSIIILVITVVFFLRFYNDLNQPSFSKYREVGNLNEFTRGISGNYYVIDQGSKRLLVINPDLHIDKIYEGAGADKDFFYATHVCDDGNGKIYISDINYGDVGMQVLHERIICIDGDETEVIKEWDYTKNDTPPLLNGRIQSLVYGEDGPVITYVSNKQVYVEKLMPKGRVLSFERHAFSSAVSNSCYDINSGILAVSLRTGEVCLCDVEENSQIFETRLDEDQIVKGISILNGELFYSDIKNRKNYRSEIEKSLADVTFEEIIKNDYAYTEMFSDADAGRLLLIDDEQLYVADMSNPSAAPKCIEKFVYNDFFNVLVLNIVALVLLILSVFVLLSVMRKAVKRSLLKNSDSGVNRFLIVCVACFSISIVISYTSLGTIREAKEEDLMTSMRIFAELMNDAIDGSKIKDISYPQAYNSDEYYEFRAPLDLMIEKANIQGGYYYYEIYDRSEDGLTIDVIVDYERTETCGTPLYKCDENYYYVDVLEKGISCEQWGEVSADGTWIFVDNPIYDMDGNIVAILEIGSRYDQIAHEVDYYIFDTVCMIFCGSAVVTMIIMEILFLYDFYDKKRKKETAEQYSGINIPIRMMVFLVYLAAGLQDAFVVIMSEKLYETASSAVLAIVPPNIGATLPIVSQLLFSAIASAFAGSIAAKYGNRNTIVVGFLIQAVGFLTCAMLSNYVGLIVGLSLNGIGLGLVYVASNAAAAAGENDRSTEKGFADVSSGVMSGSTAGVGLGSIALSIGDYGNVYALGAVLMIIGAILCLQNRNVITAKKNKKSDEKKKSVWKFVFDKKVIAFFLLILTPFMMTLAFKDCFFPLYANSCGISEVRIGQIQLLCGLAILYVGPCLAEQLINKIKPTHSIILASLLMVIAMLLFAVFPSLPTAMVGLVLFYISNGFAYTCQYYYFGELKATKEYGSSEAMSVYSVFENIGQTVGPLLFSSALFLGNSRGIMIIAIGMTSLLFLFGVIAVKTMLTAKMAKERG